MVEIDTLFQAKTAKKTYPLERHIPIYSLYKGPPPPPPLVYPGRKTRCRLSLAAYASETNNLFHPIFFFFGYVEMTFFFLFCMRKIQFYPNFDLFPACIP